MAITTRDGKTQTSLAEINMVPFIDIVLVLLIIFMITAPVIQSGIEVNVPTTEYVREISEQRIVVTIDDGQRLYLQDEPVTINELPDRIAENPFTTARQSIYLRSDESVPFGIFAAVLDRLNLAGINNVSIVTQPFETRRQ